MISIENLSYMYKRGTPEENLALNNINLEIKQGEFIVIIGPNGSGKSTLAKQLNALLLPSKGRVLVNGMDTADASHLWEIRRQVGMVFQNPDNQLVATLVEEDVAFGPENLGIDPEEIKLRVDEALAAVGMLEYRKHPPHLLSGGQKQRVAIAGVLAMKPACLVLDEPTAMLDPAGRKEVMAAIKRLNKEEGLTVVHITHFMDEAAAADRVAVMERGKIVMEGPPREIFSRVRQLKDLGLDVPQMTELAALLRNRGVPVSPEILTVDEMVKAICQLT
ncbi:energy-coupling factor transporter ATPase [Calderihabitans maritimus]|uniref:ABC transporter ATP-binding protein n=1 Tax=Calderihabitans maritimus TaxID=1246530 RepID=A0A1Z5HMY2_9FIRM|nr:energy-coupling factor transporter ATPase [Calderihabitans maritimus]GAW90879.1 cobalt ABC transporter ATP-binding protein [Calderihabitans maritimus]